MTERVIKFRQPIFNHGEFVKWHYWGFVNDGEFTGVIPPIDEAAKNSQQFTGLMDSKGKEIYEGDIIHHLEYGGNWEVVYSLENTGYDLTNGAHSMHLGSGCCPNLEVIGNIYQNPELLAVTS